jgi:hypothetical protein
MTRTALIALGALLLLGVVVSLWPVQTREALGEVTLEGVKLELYPAADPDAKWLFNASNVVYNPDTRESEVTLEGVGRRLVKGVEDLQLTAKSLTIDGNDNLRTQTATVLVKKDCTTVKLGREEPGATPVIIDQNSGYRAPFADVVATNFRQTGTNLEASFDLTEKFTMDKFTFKILDGGDERCVDGVLVNKNKELK